VRDLDVHQVSELLKHAAQLLLAHRRVQAAHEDRGVVRVRAAVRADAADARGVRVVEDGAAPAAAARASGYVAQRRRQQLRPAAGTAAAGRLLGRGQGDAHGAAAGAAGDAVHDGQGVVSLRRAAEAHKAKALAALRGGVGDHLGGAHRGVARAEGVRQQRVRHVGREVANEQGVLLHQRRGGGGQRRRRR
jgi:hypothetical protein